MMRIDKILVPVDFSECSTEAVNYGVSLAMHFCARLVLAHIVPTSAALAYTFPIETYAVEKDRAVMAKSKLPSLVPEAYRGAVGLQTIVKVGNVQDELLAIIPDEKIDLVIMGTHGRRAVERFFLGSVTECMLRKVPVPIVTVSHLSPTKQLHAAEPVLLRRILYATDLSDASEAGLRFSLDLAREAGAHLFVLHALKLAEAIYWEADFAGLGSDEIETWRGVALERLTQSITKAVSEGVKVKPTVVDGEPFREILRTVDENNIDLIVLNLQKRGRLDRAVLGSTAERVIRSAHVPVLSLPVPTNVASASHLATIAGGAA
jgi:nucleotide-binding universal stress UspA family protein